MIRFVDDADLEVSSQPTTPDEIRARCLVIQSQWSDEQWDSRAVGKQRVRWELLEVAEEPANISNSLIGIMRCYFKLEEYSNTIKAASEVLNMVSKASSVTS